MPGDTDLLSDENKRVLEATLAVLDILGDRIDELCDLADHDRQVGAAVEHLLIRAGMIPIRARGGDARWLAREWQSFLRDQYDGAPESLDQKRRQVQFLVEDICDALSQLDSVVRRPQPIDLAFDEVVERARLAYRSISRWVPPSLIYQATDRHPTNDQTPDRFYLTAAVERMYADADAQLPRAARLTLTLCINQLGPATFVAILPVLVHEVVCHVPALHRRGEDNNSRFGEGFMDWVASYFLVRWLPDIAPARVTVTEALASDVVTVMADRNVESRARNEGRRAAARLKLWYARSIQERPGRVADSEADWLVVQLGIALNMTHCELGLKDEFVAALRRGVPEHLGESLLQWRPGRPVDQILDRVAGPGSWRERIA